VAAKGTAAVALQLRPTFPGMAYRRANRLFLKLLFKLCGVCGYLSSAAGGLGGLLVLERMSK
jgi:hypothetical protein